MALNFPGSPTDGQTYVAPNGVTYVYSASETLWRVQGGDGENVVFVSATAPVSPTQGKLWWNSDTGVMYVWYIDVDGGQWVPAVSNTAAIIAPNQDVTFDNVETSSINGGPLAGMRNQLINGDFRIMQRADGSNNVVTAPSGTNYTFDRWITNSNSTTSKRIDGNGIPIAQVLSSGPIHLVQGIELNTVLSPTVGVQGFPLNSQWTLSYYSDKPPSAVGQIVEYRDSVTGGGTVPITGVPLPTATGETLGTYTRYSTTFTINASPVATSRCLVVHISSSDTASATFAYAQLEPGPVATQAEIRPIGVELSLCQRYYYTCARIRLYPSATNTSGRLYEAPRPVTMRATPTESQTSATSISFLNSSASVMSLSATGLATGSGAVAIDYTADAEL